ncbi:MAG: omptin family outer membrane protease [Treponema sp.]|nr:omptin family outer membrane protease [Treponema sp.]
MKSITPFAVFVILAVTALGFPANGHGEIRVKGKPYIFTLTPRTGMVQGVFREIVYQYSGSSDYLSELLWELNPMWYLGLGLSLEPAAAPGAAGFFADLNFRAALPMDTGVMEDRDWMVSPVPGSLTHFSAHENHTRAAILVSANSGKAFRLGGVFFLRAFVSADYWYLKMESKNGYTQYGPNAQERVSYEPWKPSWPHTTFQGTGVRYSQHWLFLSPGADISAVLGRFTLSLSFKITPLILCLAIDDHLKREILFTNIMAGGFYLEPGADISFALSRILRAGVNVGFHYTLGTRGNTIIDEYGPGGSDVYQAPGTAGAKLWMFEAGFYIKARLTAGKRSLSEPAKSMASRSSTAAQRQAE